MPDTLTAAPATTPLSPRAWRKAYANMLFADHGFARAVHGNRHQVSERMWRSAQPGPRQLRSAEEMGIRTIVNLRGPSATCGSYIIEREVCAELGLELVDFQVRSRAMPEREVLHRARELFETLRYPAMMHCKSGSDRVGFMAALYLHLAEGAAIEVAMRQLSLRYGHVRLARTGILDYFFECYRRDTGGDLDRFAHWVDEVYDPKALARAFHADRVASFFVDRILLRE